MGTTTIRVSESTRDRFARLAERTDRSMRELLDEAVDSLERKVFFAELASRYDELREDPVAWAEIQSERAIESGALDDRST